MDNLSRLRSNVDRYISKYYLNRLLKGSLTTLFIAGLAWLFVALLEYFGNFDQGIRATLFFSFLALLLYLVVARLLLPLAAYFGVARKKGDGEAANEIGHSIGAVEDKLSNLLNLEAKNRNHHDALLTASIHQKAGALNRFDFASVIDLRQTFTWIKYLSIPLAVLLLVSLWNPAILTESTRRVIRYDQSFVPPAPFEFIVQNQSLRVAEGDDLKVAVRTAGRLLPENVFVETGGGRMRMTKEGADLFVYTFSDIRTSIPFTLSGAGVFSDEYEITVMPVPKMLRSQALIDYPDYTGLKDEELLNRSQLKLPEGTRINWSFDLKHVTGAVMEMAGEGSASEPLVKDASVFRFDHTVRQDADYLLHMRNEEGLSDTTVISVHAIADAYPHIDAREMFDSLYPGVRYFNGKIADDYGFRELKFVAEVKGEENTVSRVEKRLELKKPSVEQPFTFLFNLDSFRLLPGQSAEYYFEVWDNDGIHGSKSTRSLSWTFEMPTLSELKERNDAQSTQTKSALENESREIEKMDRELEQLRKDLLQKKKPDWQDKEKMKDLLERQKRAMEQLKNNAMEQKRQNESHNRFNEYSEQLLEKQRQIQEMFDKLFDEEFQKKYEEYNRLLEEYNKEQMLDKMEEMKLDNEQLEKELDRTLELFKQLEFEQKLEETVKKSEELSRKQEALEEKTGDKSNSTEELGKEQEQLKEELKELEKELGRLEELNNSLEEPKELPSTKEEAQEAEQEMSESQEELNKNDRKTSKQKQQKAKEALDKMSQKLKSFEEQQSEEQQAENLDDMRQLLENIVDLSKAEESVMETVKTTKVNDPQYVALSKKQKDLIDDTRIVEDSLLALSKRVVAISRTVNDEISAVKQNMERALDHMTNQPPNQEQRYKEMATVRQQEAMTSLNNLAVLFDEIIRQMQSEMNSKMSGSGQCNKPGNSKGSKPSASELRKMQENLNKQLQQLKEAMEKGGNPNGKKPGQQKGMGMGGMNKELAQMAAQQAAIREQLRQLSDALNSEQGKPGSNLKELQKLMEQTEEEILYQNISEQTLKRQQDILTKLLESEKAERERELDEKRESKTATQEFEIPKDIWEEYMKEKERETELYKTVPPNLKPFYRNQVNRYFSQFAD